MSIAQRADKAKKRSRTRRMRSDVGASMAMFAPSPSFQPNVTQVKIVQNRGNLLAYLDVDLYLGPSRIFLMRGVRIVRQNDGSVYCQLPHQKSESGRCYPIICAYDPQFKAAIESAALSAYDNAVSDKIVQLAMNLDVEGVAA